MEWRTRLKQHFGVEEVRNMLNEVVEWRKYKTRLSKHRCET